jgi:hypothetical protein
MKSTAIFTACLLHISGLWASSIDTLNNGILMNISDSVNNYGGHLNVDAVFKVKKEKQLPLWNYRFSVGMGTANTMYWLLDFGQQYGEFTLDKKRNLFFKAEKMLTYRSGLAINYAQAGVDVNTTLKTDSFFSTEFQKLVPTEVTIKYRTQSLNLRYNLHFAPSEKFDPYIGISMGVRFNSIDGSVNNPIKGFSDFDLTIPFIGFTTPGGDLTLGCAGKLAGGLGYYAEIGVAKALLQAGLNYTIVSKKKSGQSKIKPTITPEF